MKVMNAECEEADKLFPHLYIIINIYTVSIAFSAYSILC